MHNFSVRGYHWVLEADIEACFDRIDHTALMERVRNRVTDKRVLALIKAFLKAGILTEEGVNRETYTGTPQGGILSPLLANIALSVLDDHYQQKWDAAGGSGTYAAANSRRYRLRRDGGATYRLIRYADDFVVMVHGKQHHAEQARAEVAEVIAPMGLVLSEAKTSVTHIDNGFDFLGYRIQRRSKPGTNRAKKVVYTYPAKKSLHSIVGKIRSLTSRSWTGMSLKELLKRLNRVVQGWCTYFKHACSNRTFSYISHYVVRSSALDEDETSADDLAETATSILLRQAVPGLPAIRRWDRALQPSRDRHRAIPMAGSLDPDTMERSGRTTRHTLASMTLMESRMR
ncbi:reverse transcriptase domain-containing protein [Nocardia sp. NPDC049190]|uniref:reverse transcriptase domain-containing protein n=1 Tax=Nocardia sp. NPDC049190 TaxID=3155650 RepID=UPI0033E586D9